MFQMINMFTSTFLPIFIVVSTLDVVNTIRIQVTLRVLSGSTTVIVILPCGRQSKKPSPNKPPDRNERQPPRPGPSRSQTAYSGNQTLIFIADCIRLETAGFGFSAQAFDQAPPTGLSLNLFAAVNATSTTAVTVTGSCVNVTSAE